MKTMKSQKTKYRNEITIFEFLKNNPDLTTREIANALDRSMASVTGQLRQLHGAGRVTPSGLRSGATVWCVNDMPFGCGSRIRMEFEERLRACRGGVR